MQITDQPRCEYQVFGRVLAFPPEVFDVFSKKLLLETTCEKVGQSLDKLFGGILEDPRGFAWAVVCTPDKSDRSEYFSLSGMMGCNDAASGVQSDSLGERGLMDAFHDDRPHPGTDVLELVRERIADTPEVASLVERMREHFRDVWGTVDAMLPVYRNALVEIKRHRLENAEEAAENAELKRREAVCREIEESRGNYSFGRQMQMRAGLAAGGFVGAMAVKGIPKVATGLSSMAASRAASRAEKDVTAWNISNDELRFFDDMDFGRWAQGIREVVLDAYAELKRVALDILVNREVEGWGTIAGMEEKASLLEDRVAGDFDPELCCEYMRARPHDVDMAVAIVSRYGAEAGGFRELQRDFGTDWTRKCDEKVSELCVDADPEDENDVQTRFGILMGTYMPGFYEGKSEFAEAKAARLREMLEKLDIQARTVSGMVCTTREAAAESREEQEKVDALLAAGKKHPLDELDKLIASLEATQCRSEYFQWVMETLRKGRSYMLTVDGTEYGSWEEAQRAFDAKVAEINGKKFVSTLLRIGTLGKEKQVLAAKYWPGSLDPDGWFSKMRHFNYVEGAKQAPEKLVALATNPARQALSKADSFLRDALPSYEGLRKKVVAKAQDISDIAKQTDKKQEEKLAEAAAAGGLQGFKAKWTARMNAPYRKGFSKLDAAMKTFVPSYEKKKNLVKDMSAAFKKGWKEGPKQGPDAEA
jgi:hypothetical protein